MWKNGMQELDTTRFKPSLRLLLDNALERAVRDRLRFLGEADLLHALLTVDTTGREFLDLGEDDRTELTRTRSLVENFMAEGVRLRDCRIAFEACMESGSSQPNPFLRSFFREPVGTWLDDLPDGAGVADLLEPLFGNAEKLPDGDVVTGLFRCGDLYQAIRASRIKAEVFAEDGTLLMDCFRERAQYLVGQALTIAARCGEECAEPSHLLAALLLCKESYTHLVLRKIGIAAAGTKITTYLQNTFPQENRLAAALPARRESFRAGADELLEQSLQTALETGESKAGEREILASLLRCEQPKVQYLFENILHLNSAELLSLMEGIREPEVIEPVLPLEICECKNLSSQKYPVIVRNDVVEAVIRVFFRKSGRNVLLHGDPGIGLSTVGDMVARELRAGKYPSLHQVQVIRFDLSSLEDADYEPAVQKLLRFFEDEPDRIYVLEGFAKYMKEHSAEISRRFQHNTYRLLIVASETDFTELDKDGEQLRACVAPVAVEEPGKQETLQMIDLALPEISKEYGVEFARGIAQTAYRMANDYLISQRFPKKAIQLLSMTASDTAAEAEMRGKLNPTVTKENLAASMADKTGLPAETILGTGADKDYVYLLSQNLVGQDAAVSKVAGRLDLIQKGMVDKKAPAAVFVFAGLSGTGKTELAKQIAQIYANSRKLITFSMENFGESHSVSRLIGTPPGYVGYEEGGKLINDLNKDPYSVVLLDEVEKAHPAVWDPFLNLFDEGIITDMRGVSASGSKAFFVLTSNIGQYEIADMLRKGRPTEEIENVVKNKFNTEVHQKSGEKCFRPEFIGRIMRRGGIVVFNALSLEALKGIAEHNLHKIAKNYGETHDSRLVCDDDVLEMIAKIVFDKNEEAIRRGNGYFGGRELDNLMNQYIQEKLASQLRQLAGVPLVRVVRSGNDTSIVPVYNDGDAQKLLQQKRLALVDKVTRRFDSLSMKDPDIIADLSEEKLTKLNSLLSEVSMIL
ncbi:MAG: AAA family ATPase [Eubacteriales bacterium]|nr:AAA family ATPase [Eubacteriales bacterium]